MQQRFIVDAAAWPKTLPVADADLLSTFMFKDGPTRNAIRDNGRELVYYRNCINMGRSDALPKVPGKTAMRTARHQDALHS